MVSAIQVEQHPVILCEGMAAPCAGLPQATATHWKERIIAAHILYEPFKILRVALFDPSPASGIAMQGQRGESQVTRHRDRGTQQVEQFDRCDRGRKRLAFRVAVLANCRMRAGSMSDMNICLRRRCASPSAGNPSVLSKTGPRGSSLIAGGLR